MAAEKVVIAEIEINVDGVLKRQKEIIDQQKILQQQQKEYTDTIKKGNEVTEEQTNVYIQNQATLKNLGSEYSQNTKILQANQKIEAEGIQTVEQARAAIAAKSIEWARLTKVEGENSAAAIKVKEETKALSDRLKELEGGVGNTSRNVGNYEESMTNALKATDAFKGGTGNIIQNFISISQQEGGIKSFFGSMISGLGSATKAAWAFVATPLGAIIAAIAVVVGIVVKAFKNFDPVIDVIQQGMEALSGVFSFVKNTITGLITGVTSLGDVFSSLGSGMANAAKEGIALKKMQQELDDMNWNLTASSEKYKTQIDLLILQSKDRTKTEKERMALIDEALKLEEKSFKEKEAVANQELEIAYRQIELGRNLTAEQKKQLRERGVQAAIDLKDTKDVSDEEVKVLSEKLAKIEKINQESIAIREKAQNRANTLAEKAEEEAAKRQEKAIEDQKKRNETIIKMLNFQVSIYKATNESKLKDNQEVTQKIVDQETKRIDKIFELETKANDKAFKLGLISKQEYELKKIEIDKSAASERDNLTNAQIQQVQTNLDIQLREYLLANKTKIESDKQLTSELIAEETLRLDGIRQLEMQQLEASTVSEQEKAIRRKEINDASNAEIANINMQFAEQQKAIQDEQLILGLEADKTIKQDNILAQFQFERDEVNKLYDDKVKKAKGNNDLIIEIEKARSKELQRINRAEFAAKLDLAAQFANNLATIFGKQTKAGKVAASAAVAIDTISGAIKAFNSFASIPVVGTALGAAAAAAVGVMGAKSIQDIWAVNEKGGTTSIPSQNLPSSSSIPEPTPKVIPTNFDGGFANSQITNNVNSQSQSQQPVLVVDEVTFKQNQNTKLQQVSTI